MTAKLTTPFTRRSLLAGAAALGVVLPMGRALAQGAPLVTMWKDPNCGCCAGWAKHMEQAGFSVDTRPTDRMDEVKRMAQIPEPLWSCHTSRVAGYVLEGHVPAGDVIRLLAQKPQGIGLAVPGMPQGSPGMESGRFDAYDVVLFGANGAASVFNSYAGKPI